MAIQKIEGGTYEMPDGKIYVVTGVINKKISSIKKEFDTFLFEGDSVFENLVIFRELNKYPLLTELQCVSEKEFRSQIIWNDNKIPLFKPIW